MKNSPLTDGLTEDIIIYSVLIRPLIINGKPICCQVLRETEDGYTYTLKQCCQESKVDVERYYDFSTQKDKYQSGFWHELSCEYT